MLVKFEFKGPRGERRTEDWDLDAVPRVGEYVHLDSVQGEVRDVAWIFKTIGERTKEARVILKD